MAELETNSLRTQDGKSQNQRLLYTHTVQPEGAASAAKVLWLISTLVSLHALVMAAKPLAQAEPVKEDPRVLRGVKPTKHG